MKRFTVLSSLGQGAILLTLLISPFMHASMNDRAQDLNFRLINIERRLDQLQSRVDFVERAQQNQAMNANPAGSQRTIEAVLDLQQQQLSLAGQVLQLQKQLLEMQKRIDRLNEGEPKPEKKEPLKDEAKPKARTTKP